MVRYIKPMLLSMYSQSSSRLFDNTTIASLTCIESIITQLPHLSSLNISDCPKLCTLTPLAMLNNNSQSTEDTSTNMQQARNLNLRHLWVRGCNLSGMSKNDWSEVFDALSRSSGPLERLTLSRNRISYLDGGIGKLKALSYLFVEDNYSANENGKNGKTFELPDELGCKCCKRRKL